MGEKKILISIDGGGIRGIIPLTLLQRIFRKEEEFNSTVKLEWWGTSSGALIAAAINLNRLNDHSLIESTQLTLDFFELRSKGLIPKEDSGIDDRAFKLLITHVFQEMKMRELANINIVATNEKSFEPRVFSDSELLVSSVLRASCALPGFFNPVEIEGDSYIDGFVVAKNPTDLSLGKLNELPSAVLSLGTGMIQEIDSIEEAVEVAHINSQKFCNENNIPYFRLNPQIVTASDAMDNNSRKNIFNLKNDAYSFISKNESIFEEILELFTK